MKELVSIQKTFHLAIWDAMTEHIQSSKREERSLGAEEFIIKCSEKVLEDISYMCGFIRDKEDSTMLPDLRLIDDGTLSSLREERFLRFVLSGVG